MPCRGPFCGGCDPSAPGGLSSGCGGQHLHVDAHGDYDTGVFAYNLIRRGWRFGLMIVGSLKSQLALNVLAIYEK